MNRTFCLFALLLCWAPLSLATPYGEWGLMGWEDSEGIPMNEAQPGMVMPEKGDVGFPAYPGAKVMFVVPVSDDFCSMAMRTPATISAVCDFYASKLKASDGYSNRLRDETSCSYLTEENSFVGVVVSHNPDPVYSSKNGASLVGVDFRPKNKYMCMVSE